VSGVYLLDWQHHDAYAPPEEPRGDSAIGFAPDRTWIAAMRRQIARGYLEGNEVGTHYNGHFCGPGGVSTWSALDWGRELDQFDRLLFRGTASFTTQDPSSDIVKLAREQAAELLIVDRVTPELLATAPCDVALLCEPSPFAPRGAVLVPFGGGREEWPALELAGWLARAHGLPLRLLGVVEGEGRRDASRTLARVDARAARSRRIASGWACARPVADAAHVVGRTAVA
jgi:hypothetical protein